MGVKLVIDLAPAIEGAMLNKAQVESITQKAVEEASNIIYNDIRDRANRNLKSTRNIYKRNLNRPVVGRLKASITLTGMLPNMLEQGASAFDIKHGFSKSSKKKLKKGGGWYLTVPFRHASSGAIGESEAFSSSMPKPIQAMAKRLTPSTTAFGSGVGKKGGAISASDLQGTKFGILGQRALITKNGGNLSNEQKAAYTHKSPKYQGLGRSEKFYALTGQGQYNTFRRVSNNSPANSWIHKGFLPRDFMLKALKSNQVGDAITRSIQQSLSTM